MIRVLLFLLGIVILLCAPPFLQGLAGNCIERNVTRLPRFCFGYPMLRGTIREYETGKRRAFLRFFACEEDWSHEPVDAWLRRAVAEGKEPLLIIGAIAGG